MMFVLCDDTSTVPGNHLVLNHHSTAGTQPLTPHSPFFVVRGGAQEYISCYNIPVKNWFFLPQKL